MRPTPTLTTVLVIVMLFAHASTVIAAPITSPDDPLLAGGRLITFDEAPIGTLDPVIKRVSFGGDLIPVEIIDIFGSLQLSNQTERIYGTPYDILFWDGASAFGADVRGVTSPVTFTAYDSSGAQLGSYDVTDFAFNGLGGFASPIARVHVDTSDFFVLDNLRFVSLPEPATGVALTLGLAVAISAACTACRIC